MKIGLKEISKRSGYSLSTVSNVLNNKKGNNPQTAEKILKIAEELGYFSNYDVTSIRFVIYKKHGKVIGETPFFDELIYGVEEECRKNKLRFEILHLERASNDFQQRLGKLIQEHHTSAILLLATEMEQEDLLPFSQMKSPILLLDAWIPDSKFDSVSIENIYMVEKAIDYLAEKGHQKIGYLKGKTRISNFCFREKGYRLGLDANNIPYEDKYQVVLNSSMEGAYHDMCLYLKENMHDLPTAYFADNDFIALGAIRAMHEFGLEIPKDVSVIGFDDVSYSRISTPPLTTIKVYPKELAGVGVRELIQKIDSVERETPMKIEICTTLLERESVYNLKK